MACSPTSCRDDGRRQPRRPRSPHLDGDLLASSRSTFRRLNRPRIGNPSVRPGANVAVSISPTEHFVRVASVEGVPPGSFTEVEIDDQVFILANVEGSYYAVSAWCTHQGTSLALGALDGSTLRCYAHLWRFDVRDGEPVWPAMAKVARGYCLRTYPVRVEGPDVMLSTHHRAGGNR